MAQNKKDSTATGAIIGLLLPLIFMTAIILYSSSKFESISAAEIILKRPFDSIDKFKELLIQKEIKIDEKIVNAMIFK